MGIKSNMSRQYFISRSGSDKLPWKVTERIETGQDRIVKDPILFRTQKEAMAFISFQKTNRTFQKLLNSSKA